MIYSFKGIFIPLYYSILEYMVYCIIIRRAKYIDFKRIKSGQVQLFCVSLFLASYEEWKSIMKKRMTKMVMILALIPIVLSPSVVIAAVINSIT